MTTSIKVRSHNHPVLVRVTNLADGDGREAVMFEHVLTPNDGERLFHATTSQRVEAVDIEYDDPRVALLKPGGGLILS